MVLLRGSQCFAESEAFFRFDSEWKVIFFCQLYAVRQFQVCSARRVMRGD